MVINLEEYKTKFAELKNELNNTLESIEIVFTLKEKLNEPRLLMEPYLSIDIGNVKERLAKGKEIKAKAKELVDYFKPFTVKYNSKDVRNLSPTLSVRDIDYVFPPVKGRNSKFNEDYKNLEEYLTKCSKLDKVLEEVDSLDLMKASISDIDLVEKTIKAIPGDVYKSLPPAVRDKMDEISKASEAKKAFDKLYNSFVSLDNSIGHPPRYKSLSEASLNSFKKSLNKVVEDAQNFDTRYRKYINEDKLDEIISKSKKHLKEIDKRLFKSRFADFLYNLGPILLTIGIWLLLLAPLGFVMYTSINTTIIMMGGLGSVWNVIAGILLGLINSGFKFMTLLLGMGYYWQDIYSDMPISPLIIQIIYTGVLVISITLKILLNTKLDSFDNSFNRTPLAVINWIALTGLFIMPFVMSFAPAIIAAYRVDSWAGIFTQGIRDGFYSLMAYITGFGFTGATSTATAYIKNPLVMNILFYAYILAAILVNIVFRRKVRRKLI